MERFFEPLLDFLWKVRKLQNDKTYNLSTEGQSRHAEIFHYFHGNDRITWSSFLSFLLCCVLFYGFAFFLFYLIVIFWPRDKSFIFLFSPFYYQLFVSQYNITIEIIFCLNWFLKVFCNSFHFTDKSIKIQHYSCKNFHLIFIKFLFSPYSYNKVKNLWCIAIAHNSLQTSSILNPLLIDIIDTVSCE